MNRRGAYRCCRWCSCRRSRRCCRRCCGWRSRGRSAAACNIIINVAREGSRRKLCPCKGNTSRTCYIGEHRNVAVIVRGCRYRACAEISEIAICGSSVQINRGGTAGRNTQWRSKDHRSVGCRPGRCYGNRLGQSPSCIAGSEACVRSGTNPHFNVARCTRSPTELSVK